MHMIKKTIVVAALSLLSVGSAYAGTSTATVPVTIKVEANCEVLVDGDISAEIAARQGTLNEGFIESRRVFATCSDLLPYTVETNADAEGKIFVTNTSGQNKTYFATVKHTDGRPFSTIANSGEWSNVGNGRTQFHEYEFKFDAGDNGVSMLTAGVYTGAINMTLTF
ncbi:hypothetical protein [Stenotrophomonas maltophilia]|uniref:hypothetical protein n=1 Tax=Stenotrophomonas maltophilia TaxID=40324 RepID=UPI0011473CA0|nr:hypothetical protein [Stenotrophomonas maltophilia]MCD5965571.1 hypothetical protein [Stenotrophomonas maltophilia]QGL75294.1 hypothetical protein FEO95_06485 [Stenotrophomonas maltophilia]